MQNRNDRPARRTSPGPDWVLWLMIAAAAVLATIGLLIAYRMIHDARAQAALNCPPQDHAVWAQTLDHGRGEWICGASLTVGVKSR